MTRVPREELLVDETFRAKLVEEGERRVEEALGRARLAKSRAPNTPPRKLRRRAGTRWRREAPQWWRSPSRDWPCTGTRSRWRIRRRAWGDASRSCGEWRWRSAHISGKRRGASRGAEAFDFRVDAPKKEDPAAKKGGPAAAAAAAAAASESADAAEAPDPDSFEATLYDPSALYPPRRKMTQLALLEMTTREVKRAFNVEFAEMEAEKQKFLDKIGGINSRIADIRLELKGHTDDAVRSSSPSSLPSSGRTTS